MSPRKQRKNRAGRKAAAAPDPNPASDVSTDPPQESHALPAWKKVLFAIVAVVGFFALLEAALAAIGVAPVLFTDDPYVGFASNIPLFVESQGETGGGWMETAPNKIRWFNQQRFSKRKGPSTYRIFSLGGSTTYGRPYDDKGSFSGWLREILAVADPSERWEVINAGGVSYASYRVAVVMEELVRYEPDLFIVYSGHNEFLEKRTYSEISAAPQLFAETGGLFSRTRIYAAAQNAIDAVRRPPTPKGEVLRAEVDTMLEHSVGPSQYFRDEEWRAGVIEHYRFNLRRMVEIARSARAELIFVTPSSDLRGSSPFKSEHRSGLPAEAREEFGRLLDQASEARRNANPAQALELAEGALTLDDRYAAAHFERGQALYALGRFDEAATAFERSLDEDICPLRILTPMQQILRDVAAETGSPLVDFDSFMRSRSPHGVTGPEYFLDHVHLNLDGYRLLALELLDELVELRIVSLSPDWGEEQHAAVSKTVESRIDAKEHGIALRNLAKVLDWAGKQEEAERLASQAVESLGGDAESLNVMGRAALSRGELQTAVAYFERALEARPGYLEPLTPLGIALQDLGRSDEAIAAFRAAIEGKQDFAEAHYNLGSALMAKGLTGEAVAAYREALLLDPENAPAYNNLGIALASRGQLDEAIANYRRALAVRSQYTEAMLNLGLALQARGDREEGVALIEQALDSRPESPEALINVGNVLLATNRVDEAIDRYEQALRLAPDSAVGFYNLGNALLQAGRWSDAAAAFGKAAHLDPASPKVQTNLGRALLASGRPSEAVRAYRRALELSPDSAQALFNTAAALGEAGQVGDAIALYRKAIKIRPDYADAYSNLGNLLLAGNQTSEAIQNYERALELRPDFVEAHYNLGMALGLDKKVAGAIRHFTRVIELQPDHAQAHHYLGVSLDLAGRHEEALRHQKIASELRPN